MTKYLSKLQDKRVLVVGGSSGIGFAVAEAAVEYGAVVILASSQQSKIDNAIAKMVKTYPNAKVTGQACDLSNADTADESVKKLLEFAAKEGKLDHIVNTAGDSIGLGELSTVTPQAFFARQQVRLVASLLLAKHSVKHMNISSASSLTFTGGVNTYKPARGWAVASGTGGGIEGLTRGLAVELQPVRVNMVAPGAIFTELWTRTFPDAEKAKESWASKTMTGGVGLPEDTAEAYLYFMKDKFVTGQHILTDGGYVLM